MARLKRFASVAHPSSQIRGAVYLTTPKDSLSWIWWDVPARLLPLAVGPLVFLWLSHMPASSLGISFHHLRRDLLLAVPLGVVGFAIAAVFMEYLSRRNGRWFAPTVPDLALQVTYYVVLNAPIEEWFFRGFLQGMLGRWWQSPLLGFLAATTVFGGYHLLGRWHWRAVAAATVAGAALGALYLWQPAPPSLLLPVIVHGAITCGFLGAGPYLFFHWRRRQGYLRPQVDAPQAVS
jgi:membrane protease YdiL (CAAX protease family)